MEKRMSEFEKTGRGFDIYGELEDRYGAKVRVQESSIAGEPCCWVFCNSREDDTYHKDRVMAAIERAKTAGVVIPHVELVESGLDNSSPHLTVPMAKQLIEMLQAFVGSCEDPEHWKNDPEYKAAWRDEEE